MTRKDYRFFIEAMSDLGDEWTEDEISTSEFAEMPLNEAIKARTDELSMFGTAISAAFSHILNN